MRNVNRLIAWVLAHCFLLAPLPLAAEGRLAPAPKDAAERASEQAAECAAPESTDASGRIAKQPAPADASGRIANPPAPVRVSRLVAPGAPAVLELDGVRLEVPAGAVGRATEVSITRLAVIARLDEGMSNVTGAAGGFRFEPQGMQFRRPVRITMAFDPRIAESEAALSNLYTYFLDEVTGRWERLERMDVNPKAAVVTSRSSHFTDMINATLKLPEGPQPIQYDVSSIKKLQAANPGEGVPAVDGPQPGPFGAASFSIPLRLPPGRGGASPQLALRYSSDGGQGWLGKGFDIEVPAITIDTRFGLPRYDGADRYSLNGGEELLPIGTDRDGSLLFQPRVERSFSRIRWYRAGGAGGAEDWWQVTEKNGTVSDYGRTEAQAWLGPDRVNRARTFAWYLSKRVDSFGNSISYRYFSDQRVSAPGIGPNNFTYLSDIYYTGFEGTGDPGAFHIQFALEPADRQDRRLDSRGTFPSKMARRLSQVQVFYRSSLVRSWQFTYQYNEFGQSLLSSYAEADGPGSTQFYRYSFEYYALEQKLDQGSPAGWQAFGPEEAWPLQAQVPFKGLNASTTSSLGGDLYIGVEIGFRIPILGVKIILAEFGIRGGLQFSSGGTVGTLLDANGDGLPDLAWKSGGSLAAFLNTGSGFDTANPFILPGLTGAMDAEQQNTFSFGMSAGLLGASGAITWQESWSQGNSGFMDVNGDGLVDYVSAGGGTFGLNTGRALTSMGWSSVPAVSGGAAGSDSETYARNYYLQEPFRAWKAYRSGTVVVDQEAGLLQPSASSNILLMTDPPRGSVPAPLHLTPQSTSTSSAGQQYDVNAGERIYFHASAGSVESADAEASQGTRWNVQVRYSRIKLFEYLKEGALFYPVKRFFGETPEGDYRLLPIYDVKWPGGGSSYCDLKEHWEDYATLGVYAALIEHGHFVPHRVPRDMFLAILDAASQEPAIPLTSPMVIEIETETGTTTRTIHEVDRYKLITEGFIYEPETASFIYRENYHIQATDPRLSDSDSLFMLYANVLSNDQKRSLARIRTIDSASDTTVRDFADGTVGYERSAPQRTMPAIVADAGASGNMLPEQGLFLETTYDSSGVPYENLWLRQDAGGQWTVLARESRRPETPGQTTLEPGAANATLTPTDISVALNDHGINRGCSFTGNALVEQLPDSLYTGVVSAAILSGQAFSTLSVSALPAATWDAITGASNPENDTYKALNPCYELGVDGSHHLKEPPTCTDAELQAALRALQAAAPQSTGSIFTTLPSDLSGEQRLILLSQAQMDGLVGAMVPAEQTRLAACFTQLVSSVDEKACYYQAPGLSADDLGLVRSAMERYRRDVELFPYYAFNPSGNVWNIKAGVPSDQAAEDAVNACLNACGIQVWTILDRTIRYTSGQMLEVVGEVSLPAGATEDPIVPTGTRVPADGEAVSIVMVPGFDQATGNTVVTPHYFHVFDSSADYSSQDLVVFPSDGNGPLYQGDSTMSGGVFGWYYGVWSGYYGWDKARLGQDPRGRDNPYDARPPYSVTMSPNLKPDGSVSITTSGREHPVSVPGSAWVGNVSSYSDVTTNADLSTTHTQYNFAVFLNADELFIGRNGGDAYYRIPRGSGSGGGSLPFVRNSHTSSTDLNGSIGIPLGDVARIGTSASRNTGSSWQYQGLLDMNGDRYPDLVSFTDSGDGSSGFSVVPGNGQGFGSDAPYSLGLAGHISKYSSTSFGFGASMGSTSGGISTSNGSNGKTKSTSVIKPSSLGMNGTFGCTIQSEGFHDMNGDGLPDYVTRGDGDFRVALNRGDRAFDPSLDWGSGIMETAFPSGGTLPNMTSGVSFTGTGSFGASGGIDAGVGVSAGFNATVNQTFSALSDVNGDGLADHVVKLKTEDFFRIRCNLGDHFAAETRLYRPPWTQAVSGFRESIQSDLSSLSNGLNGVSLPGGSSIPAVRALPDQGSNPMGAAYDPFSIEDDLEYSTGASFNLGVNISIPIPLAPLITLTICPGVNGSVASTSASLKFTDIDGDGLPDHVLKLPGESFLRIKRNLSGKSGLLRTIHAPQGGSYELTYGRAGNTVDMPQSKWVLAGIAREDGMAMMAGAPSDRGARSYTESFVYRGGYYDRVERLFYGFAEVSAARASGAVSTTRYLNRDYYTRGMSSGSELQGPDAGGETAVYQQASASVQKTLVRSVRRLSGETVDIYFPAVSVEASRQYEAGSSSFVETSRRYAYDVFGNVADFWDNGTTGESGQAVHAHIDYDLDIPGADYQKQSPCRIRVESATGTLMRLREGAYGSRGELLRLGQYENAATMHSCSLSYDAYGNLSSIADPRGHALSWTYDDEVHTYAALIRTSNSRLPSPQYDSRLEWNYALGKKTAEIDQNGQRMSCGYDVFGRLAEVRSPYDTGDVPAVSFQYSTGASAYPWTAVTFNKVLYDPDDAQVIQTVIAIDGLGRTLQTAKQGERRDALGVRTVGWNLSGAVAYDSSGRVTQEGQPQFAAGMDLPGLALLVNPTATSYDAQDRVVRRVLPDGATILSSYRVGSASARLVTKTVDPLGAIEMRETDGRGNVTSVSRCDQSAAVLMSATYRYDGLSQILAAVDSRGNAVQVSYDLLGRRASLQSADTGIQAFTYDEAGNLARKVTSVLRARGKAIEYQYDGLNRLATVIYPESATVRYTYGGPGAPHGGAGRLIQREDASGTVRWRYGLLGETTRITRSVTRLTPLEAPVSATLDYVSDYLGRMQQITYPDGEVLRYEYDSGGQVRKVTGVHWGQTTEYVRDIGYDEFGQRTYIEYGNGVRTTYSYDPARRWLAGIASQTGYGRPLQAMTYRFDLVGNVLGYSNAGASYTTSQSYGYDALYQVIRAEGSSTSRPSGFDEWTSGYQQSFGYDQIGNMTSKSSSCSTNPARSVGDDLNYSLAYSYYPGKGHQAEIIGRMYYRYDANGNVIEEREGGHGTGLVLGGTVSRTGDLRITDTGFGLVPPGDSGGAGGGGGGASSVYTRRHVWDEENRLTRTVSGNLSVDYRYGADGQRAVKYSSRGESLYFDSMWQAQTDYPSLRQSKHVYVGSTRVATRLNIQGQLDTGYERVNTYYYHGDHLGSSQLVTDYQGDEYERMEYTPYGESWIEKRADSRELLPYKFTGKELDSETGLYYYGARYMHPRTSRWMSADPAMGEYLPVAPVSAETWQRNALLPGMGGVFNLVNLAVYAYAANNPVRYVDPTGRDVGDKELYAVTPTARGEMSRTNTLAASGATYGSTPGLGGTVVGMDLDKYDCTGAMSAVAQKPYLSTAELSDTERSSGHYEQISPEDFSAGDWIVVRYTEAGKTEVEGHAQMKMTGGKYFDSNAFKGPTMSKKSVLTYLDQTGATIVSVMYLRPKENE